VLNADDAAPLPTSQSLIQRRWKVN